MEVSEKMQKVFDDVGSRGPVVAFIIDGKDGIEIVQYNDNGAVKNLFRAKNLAIFERPDPKSSMMTSICEIGTK